MTCGSSSSSTVKEKASKAGISCWVSSHLKAKWMWAGHIARMSGYRPNSWALKATFWRDDDWKAEFAEGMPLHSTRPLRCRAGRWKRWEDEIVKFSKKLGTKWKTKAEDKTKWKDAAGTFAEFSFR